MILEFGLRAEPDYTLIPGELDRKFEKYDEDSALRPTIMKVGKVWEKSSQAALLADPSTSSLDIDKQKNEKDRFVCFFFLNLKVSMIFKTEF